MKLKRIKEETPNEIYINQTWLLWWPRAATQILQFFKDFMKNKRKSKSKLKVKWNVTAKQRKKND